MLGYIPESHNIEWCCVKHWHFYPQRINWNAQANIINPRMGNVYEIFGHNKLSMLQQNNTV